MGKNEKDIIRKRILSIRNTLDVDVIERNSENICGQILETACYKKAEIILGYIPTRGEVNILPVLEDAREKGKKIYIPKVLGKRKMEFFLYEGVDKLKKGNFGIPEPKEKDMFIYDNNIYQDSQPSSKLLMIIPGVAFDINKNRLGYGGGFYDTYLEGKDIVTIAPIYDFQLVEELPAEIFDKKGSRLIKPKR